MNSTSTFVMPFKSKNSNQLLELSQYTSAPSKKSANSRLKQNFILHNVVYDDDENLKMKKNYKTNK